MSKLVDFVQESYQEMIHKVTWPKYSQLQGSAVLVLIASLIFALAIFAIDQGISTVTNWFYQNF